ncbi:hypothetical protein E5206_16615 [Arthrobacter sp. PAMC25564]|uniref:DUF485 domain-containing protein n=1 Tax=Arthrobacter sp. PAMC25564 TaxID=2565366 RepID=UPI0010A2A431|nr:DUF485 domain-containing protein [Arthrobacter sp. PAMC25564]QCB98339.1 hypothetical protein E5206_16615 [Arthrobacter sp. PAMC25564]
MTRVRVTAPRTSAQASTALPAARSAAELREAAEESDAGQVFVRSLIRSQLRLGVVVAGGFMLILLAFPLMLGLVPGLAESKIAGLPFDWVLLGAGIYPVIGLGAWLYVRTAARNEARYRELAGDK